MSTPEVSKTTPTRHRMDRQNAAESWMVLFIVLAVAASIIAFIAAGNVFEVPDEYSGDGTFNAAAAFGAGVTALLGSLPIVALFDYLRRGPRG